MYKKMEVGKKGEDLSCKYLERNGYNIIERNFTCSQGEIDIIAYDIGQKEIVFVEVKTRMNFNYGFPSDAITKAKIRHMKKCAEYYVFKKKVDNYYLRFDVIEIVVSGKDYKLNHLRNVI